MTIAEFHEWEKERIAAVLPILAALLASGDFTEAPLDSNGVLSYDHGKERDKEIYPRRYECQAITVAIDLEDELRFRVRELLCLEININDPGDLDGVSESEAEQ